MSTVFRRLRRHGGARGEVGDLLCPNRGKPVNLGVTDKQVAEQKAAALIRDNEREGIGLIAPQTMRLAATRRLGEHVIEFTLDREACGRSESHITHLRGRLGRLLHECG